MMNFKLKEFQVLDIASNVTNQFEDSCIIFSNTDKGSLHFTVKQELNEESNESNFNFSLSQVSSFSRIGNKGYVFNFPDNSCYLITFKHSNDISIFNNHVQKAKENKQSKFCNRTDESSASQYFQFYGYLSQQQNMLQDYIRTSTYERAVLANSKDFQDKVVLDVGAGSGILSFFSVQAGAARVYAVEASSMAEHAEVLVNFNYLSDKIMVIPGKVEEIELPEQVDIIISEPMGYMLYNERMLETYLHAKKWLKKDGKMFPTQGNLYIAPFTDEALFIEQTTKASFWLQTHFHNIDLTALHDAALSEYFRQPVVDTFDIRMCTAKPVSHTVDFLQAEENDLHRIEIPLEFTIMQTATIHGLAFWFDVAFIGSTQTVWLSTSPTEQLTHWYQVRCLLSTPIFARVDQKLIGKVILEANTRQSYDVNISVMIEGFPDTQSCNCLDLKNPYFRYTGQASTPPPGLNSVSPTEAYWNQVEAQNTMRQVPDVAAQTTFDINQWAANSGGQLQMNALNNTVNMVNGISLNGYGDMLDIQQPAPAVINMVHQVAQPVLNSTTTAHNRSRQRRSGTVPTSTCGAQLIGGGISPNILTNQTSHLLITESSHALHPSNPQMLAEYVSSSDILNPQM